MTREQMIDEAVRRFGRHRNWRGTYVDLIQYVDSCGQQNVEADWPETFAGVRWHFGVLVRQASA